MKFLYILTSNGRDKYIDMTYVSAVFLRYLHPNSQVLLGCDSQSFDGISKSGHPLIKLVDDVISCETPDREPSWRNRYVKCRMRRLLSGNFLYLDADTMPVKPLMDLFSIRGDFGAVSNHNRSIENNIDSRERHVFLSNDWRLPTQLYVNGGVLYWADTKKAHELCNMYIHKWEQASAGGNYYDQPALNAALVEWAKSFEILDHKYNAQFIMNPRMGVDAHIWHKYFSVNVDKFRDYFSDCLDLFVTNGFIDESYIRRVLQARIPYVTKTKGMEAKLIRAINQKGFFTMNDYNRSQRSLLRRILDRLKALLKGRGYQI